MTSHPTDSPSLRALFRAEFEVAKELAQRKARSQYAAIGVGMIGVVVPAPGPYICSAIALTLACVSWWWGREAKERRGVAEEGRRRDMLADALGRSGGASEIETIRRFSAEARAAAVERDATDDYYASKCPPGVARLVEHLQQSAFWSQHLYEHAARRLARSLAVPGLVLAAALALMAVPLDGLPLVVVKVTTVLVAGFVGIDWLGTCLEWRAAAAEASRTDARLLATPEPDWEGTIAVFGDYSVAVASVPPIPTAIHGREERRLDGLWAARLQASRDGRVATSS